MNNVLIYSDLHINQSSLKECITILEEIGMLTNKYNIDTLINLGDTFDGLKPSSQELDVFATFIKRLGNDKKHIILAADSHESTTQEESILNHYGILSDNVQIVKEYKDGNHLYCGHFSIKESIVNYGAKLSKEDLKNYIYVFLGHIHSYQVIKPNICHLGSCRYVDFDEAKDEYKVITIISDYKTEQEEVHFMKLKSPIPMIQLELGKNNPKEAILDTISDQNKGIEKDTLEPKSRQIACINPLNSYSFEAVCQFLDKADHKTKVKVKILDFESFRQFLPLCSKYNTKFETFKYETDFTIISVDNQNCKDTAIVSFKEAFINWLNNQKIDDKIREILQKEIE
jgi:DNA repair exonuclease SbcCD nuclease subunit